MRPRLAGATAVAVLAGLLGGCAASSAAVPGAPSPSFGIVQDRAVPQVTLEDAQGRPATLGDYRGRIVVLAPFLSLCQEECPLTTGAFLSMERAVDRAGLGGKVVFAEVSVDPGRDTPARLAAYAQRFGVDWPLLTGTPAELSRLWGFFGIYAQVVPEPQPPGLDWWTGKPLSYDVDHSDGFILLGTRGHERFITTTPPNLHGKLRGDLRELLDQAGLAGLDHPEQPAWTVPQALSAIGWLAGRYVPASPGR